MKVIFKRYKSWSDYTINILITEPYGARYALLANIDWWLPGHQLIAVIYTWVPVGSKEYRYIVEDLEQ